MLPCGSPIVKPIPLDSGFYIIYIVRFQAFAKWVHHSGGVLTHPNPI